jgi:drug/metabolite transporter (DMT)-like permease
MISPPEPHPKHLKKGIFFILLAFLCFTSMFAMSRFTAKLVSTPMILFFQSILCLPFMIPWVVKHGMESFKTRHFGLIFVRTCCGFISYGLTFLAVQKISLVNTMLLSNSAPLLVPFVIWIWMKVKINHRLWPGIFLGFIGIILILRPNREIFDLGAFYALGAAGAIAINILSLRLLAHAEKGHTVLLYYFGISTLLSLPLCILYWQPLSWEAAWQLVCIGILGAIGQFAYLKAFHYGKASQLSPFIYAAVIYAAFFDWALFGKIPDLLAVLGIVLVCGGGILTMVFSRPIKKI